jgi:hypothetical protein
VGLGNRWSLSLGSLRRILGDERAAGKEVKGAVLEGKGSCRALGRVYIIRVSMRRRSQVGKVPLLRSDVCTWGIGFSP